MISIKEKRLFYTFFNKIHKQPEISSLKTCLIHILELQIKFANKNQKKKE